MAVAQTAQTKDAEPLTGLRAAAAAAETAAPLGPEFSKDEELDTPNSATCCGSAASEEKAGQLYGMGLIGGFLPSLYRRWKAVVVGMQMVLKARRRGYHRIPATTVTCLACAWTRKESWPS